MSESKWADLEQEGLLGFLRVIVIHRKLIGLLLIVGTVLAIGVCLFVPKQWQARATIVPSSVLSGKSQELGIGALASQFSGAGLLMAGGQKTASSLYPWIVSSNGVGEQALQTTFIDASGQSQLLIERFAGDEPDSSVAIHRGLKKLRQAVVVKFERKSGVSSIVVTLDDPRIAADLANVLVAALDEYSRSVQVGEASEQFDFINQRLQETGAQLEAAEAALMNFELSNRQWPNSPQLSLRHNRFARDVQLNQELFVTLKTQMELARIEAVKNMPLISVIDHATVPLRAYAPQTVKIVLAAAFLLLALAILVALILNHFSLSAARSADLDEKVGF